MYQNGFSGVLDSQRTGSTDMVRKGDGWGYGQSSRQVAVAWMSDKEVAGKQVTLKVSFQPMVEAM